MFTQPTKEEYYGALDFICGDEWKLGNTKEEMEATAILMRAIEYAEKRVNIFQRHNPLHPPFPFKDLSEYTLYVYGERHRLNETVNIEGVRNL